ncbi:hypothetical protein [Marinomonas sp. PE14-40]|uniref:hypothetical protein n=1 Tax=Marinomonas sp. PE14-40 TaxID=3060621 RepID=UPI003F66A003
MQNQNLELLLKVYNKEDFEVEMELLLINELISSGYLFKQSDSYFDITVAGRNALRKNQ